MIALMADSDASDAEIDRVMTFLRAGKNAQVGGGRSFYNYVIRDGQPIVIDSCDGCVEEHVVSEEAMRDRIRTDRALFLDYLRMWEKETKATS